VGKTPEKEAQVDGERLPAGSSQADYLARLTQRREAGLANESVSVEHLLDAWLCGYVARKGAPGPQPGDLQYHSPPEQLSGELADATKVGRGTNQRMAWEKDGRRYEFDSQENALEVYQLSNGKWLHEAHFDGTARKTTGDKSRRWGKT